MLTTTRLLGPTLGLLLATAGLARADQVLKEGDNFAWTAEQIPGAARGQGKLALTLIPRGNWKVTLEAPLKVALAPPAGLTLSQKQLTKADLVVKTKERARFEVGYQATAQGKLVVKLNLEFVLCDDKVCQKKKLDAEVALQI